MRNVFLFICLTFLCLNNAIAQDLKILSVSKSKFKIDSRPKKYLIQNKISRDTLMLNINKSISESFKKNNLSAEFIGLNNEQANALAVSKLYTKKVIVNANERKPTSKFSFFRLFRKKNLKNKVFFLKPNAVIGNNPSNIGAKGLIVISKYRINNRWALNYDFRNKTTITLYYSIYDSQGVLIKHYRSKMDFNFQKDMNKEVLFHIQNKLAQNSVEQIVAELK